jgi:hypothetical protein
MARTHLTCHQEGLPSDLVLTGLTNQRSIVCPRRSSRIHSSSDVIDHRALCTPENFFFCWSVNPEQMIHGLIRLEVEWHCEEFFAKL